MRIYFKIALSKILIVFYLIAFIISFFAITSFIPVAFDSGGVASGPMTSTFLLPLAMGACMGVGGNVVTDAFGIVSAYALDEVFGL